MKNTAYIFFNGIMDTKNIFYKKILKDKRNIFCADGGLKYALELNLTPLELWGDLDSIDSTLVEKARKLGTSIVEFNSRKNFTDGELIVNEISKKNYDEIFVLGGLGGRTDHLLTNLNLLFKYDNLYFLGENEIVFKVKDNYTIENQIDKTISFVPMSDEVKGLTLTGFEYPLHNHTLKRGDSLCMSNIIKKEKAVINFNSGKILGILQL